jgi:ankyrin repeat protein
VRVQLEHGAPIDASSGHYNATPLHVAAGYTNQPSVITLLLDHGANIEARDNENRTPLYMASRFNADPSVIRLLLDRGADIEARGINGGTPLHAAAALNFEPSVIELLLNYGSDVNAKDSIGITPLHWAAAYNLESVVELLLDRGAEVAEVNVRDNGRVTPLHDAAMSSSNPKVIKLLLDYGADSKARESDGHTACELLQYNDVLKGHTLSEVRDWLCR